MINCIFECKGTSTPIGEYGNYYLWIANFNDNMYLLKEKANLLYISQVKGYITHPFVTGFQKIVINQIQMEAIYYRWAIMNLRGFIWSLKELKTHVENDSHETSFLPINPQTS